MNKINLYNEDCLSAMMKMKDNQFDLGIVDPPYGIGEDGKKNHSRDRLAPSKKYTPKNWDSKSPDSKYFKQLKRVCKNTIIWGANHFIEKIPSPNSSGWLVWDKLNGNNHFADCELAYTTFKTSVRKFTFRWAGMLQGDMKNKEVRIHPTQKPIKLYEWILINYAKKGDKILDTHLGSGSSAIASFNYGFKFDGYEIDKEYFDNAVKRIKEHSKQQKLF